MHHPVRQLKVAPHLDHLVVPFLSTIGKRLPQGIVVGAVDVPAERRGQLRHPWAAR